jgi:hypothetical protein
LHVQAGVYRKRCHVQRMSVWEVQGHCNLSGPHWCREYCVVVKARNFLSL